MRILTFQFVISVFPVVITLLTIITIQLLSEQVARITLGNGDYTTTTFATELQTKAAALGITAAYNSTNRHFTFHSGVTGFSIVVPNSQYKYLGLSTGTHIATGTTLFQLESDEVVDLSGTNEINIVTSLQVNSTNTEDGNLNR